MEEPVRVIESGPAAGALTAANYGRVLGFRDLISFDMGGTTAKVCLIEDGRLATTSQVELDRMKMQAGSGLPINIPGIDLLLLAPAYDPTQQAERLAEDVLPKL